MKNLLSLLLYFYTNALFTQPTFQWQKTFGGTQFDEATSIQQTNDGGYIVCGYTLSNNGDVIGNHGAYDFWIIKLTDVGMIQWKKTLGGSDTEWAYFIQQTNDGGYVVSGFTQSNNGDVSGNHGDKDCWIVKLNNMGVTEWQKTFGGGGWDEAWCMRQTNDGGYVIAGRSNSLDGDVTGNHGASDFWIVKISDIGVIEWQKSLGGSLDDKAYSIRQTLDGGYIVAGETDSNDGDVSDNNGGTDYWVVKLNELGDIQWQKALGSSSLDRSNDVYQTSDGGYIVLGEVSGNDGDV